MLSLFDRDKQNNDLPMFPRVSFDLEEQQVLTHKQGIISLNEAY